MQTGTAIKSMRKPETAKPQTHPAAISQHKMSLRHVRHVTADIAVTDLIQNSIKR